MKKDILDVSKLVLDESGRAILNDSQLLEIESYYSGGQITPTPNREACIKSNSYCGGSNAACANAPFCGGSKNGSCNNGASCGGSTNRVC